MKNKVKKLLSISSLSISPNTPKIPDEWVLKFGKLIQQLEEILKLKNGFFAFENALHIFPCNSDNYQQDLLLWNQFDLWKKYYPNITNGVCFGEDIFGVQFTIHDDNIFKFDPETGEMEIMASNFEDWAEIILEEYEVETGYPIAHEWQTRKGVILIGERLLPKVPFVLGGEFDISNLQVTNVVEGMRLRGNLAAKLKTIPDGSKIRFNSYEDIVIL